MKFWLINYSKIRGIRKVQVVDLLICILVELYLW